MRLKSLILAGALVAGVFAAAPASAYEIDVLTGKPLVVSGDPSRATVDPIPREEVAYNGKMGGGSIFINTSERRLYYVLGNGKAIRYGIGVGRPGFDWAGTNRVSRKAEWPDWTPPPEMIQRQPYLPRFMAGGPGNPMGARAMYLGTTVYRIHGTNQPMTIGQAVSSGCFGMVNADIIDLYERVPVGTKVVVKQRPSV